MIARIWHGWTSPDDADAYQDLLLGEVLPGINDVGGYEGAILLRRAGNDEEIEFVTITMFDSMRAVREFAGEDDFERAVVPPQARRLLRRFDQRSAHYDLISRPDRDFLR